MIPSAVTMPSATSRELPSAELLFWKVDNWRCEYWKDADDRGRLFVFRGDEAIISEPAKTPRTVCQRADRFRAVVGQFAARNHAAPA